ncbi:LysR family transcriptional regulator [Cronobacter dublinensis]
MNILQLDMNLLKVLYVMLQTGSTGETAQRLSLTPSAVSHALARLREALGDTLFRREGNRQHPTPFALSLRDKLVPLFVSLNEEMFGEPPSHDRRFRIVVPPALNTLLAPVLAQRAHQAQATVECVAFERRAWRDDLVDGSIDLLLAVGDHQKQLSALHYERVGQTRLVILYGPPLRHLLAGQTRLTLAALCDYPHAYCHPWPQPENELDRQLARAGLARRLGFICTDYAQLPGALREAPLLAVVPWPWFATLKDNQQLFMLELADEKALGSLFLQYRTSTVAWKKRLISAVRQTLTTWYG